MNTRILITLVAYMMAIFFTATALAVDFCATSSTEIQAALTEATSNGESDHIKIKKGNYDVSSGGFQYGSGNQDSEFFDLEISGGWYGNNNNPCSHKILTTPTNTVLDGGDNNRILRLDPSNSTNITITDIHFTHGFIDQDQGGGALLITASLLPVIYTGRIIIERNIFADNYGDYGAVYIASSSGTVDVRNNLFAFNDTQVVGTAAFTYWPVTDPDGDLHFSNNTVVENTTSSINTNASSGVAVFAQTNATVFIGNNILWGNQRHDLAINGSAGPFEHIVIRDSDIESRYVSVFLNVDLNNVSVEPVFQDSEYLNYSLDPTSPLINLGHNSSGPVQLDRGAGIEWYMGDLDILGKPRVYNTIIDIGAFEFYPDVIFVNDFE